MKVLVQEVDGSMVDQPEFMTFSGETELTQKLCIEIMEGYFGDDMPDIELTFEFHGDIAVLSGGDSYYQIVKLPD